MPYYGISSQNGTSWLLAGFENSTASTDKHTYIEPNFSISEISKTDIFAQM